MPSDTGTVEQQLLQELVTMNGHLKDITNVLVDLVAVTPSADDLKTAVDKLSRQIARVGYC